MNRDNLNQKKFTLRQFVGAAAIGLLTSVAAFAQIDQRFAHAQQENALALRKYEWKARTEIQKDGETKRVQLALMRYDLNGNVQTTTISSTPEPDLPKFGLRKAIGKKKMADFKDKLEQLSALARSYSELAPDTMQRFIATATVSPEITMQQKLVRVEGRDVLHSGDSLTLWIDALSHKQRRVEIHTSLDGKPVRIVSDFQDLPQRGPTYMARSQVNYDGTDLVIVTENFDYVRVS